MRRMKILLAEDDVDDRFIFENFLGSRSDIELLPYAENGLEVFSFLDAVPSQDTLPDMIIMDHNMPKMSGLQALEQLKQTERYAHIPVFIYSTYADTQLIETCTASGATMVVTKPLNNKGYQDLLDSFLKVLQQESCHSKRG